MTLRSPSDIAPTPAVRRPPSRAKRAQASHADAVSGGGTPDPATDQRPADSPIQSTAVAGVVVKTVRAQGKTFATFERLPLEASAGSIVDPLQRVRLSRFAFLHAEAGTLVLETALSDVRATLVDPRSVTIVTMLALPASARDVADAAGCASDVAGAFVGLLVGAGLATEEGAGSSAAEDAHASAWEFHDLLFHRRSRSSPLVRSSGRRLEAPARTPPVPAPLDTDGAGGDGVLLPRGDGASLTETVTLGRSLTRRQSVRTFGARPLTAAALGEFLFRSAGVSRRHGDGSGVGHRPYPSGGGCYPLEIYPLIVSCDGLAAGVYWYDAHGHRLCFRHPVSDGVEALIAGGVPDAGAPALPHVVLVVAARFQRVQSAYEAIAYSLILKEVGALMQTMYLVAAAMDLGGCALGWGDAELFARTSGLPALVQGSVGEFALGTIDRRADRTGRR